MIPLPSSTGVFSSSFRGQLSDAELDWLYRRGSGWPVDSIASCLSLHAGPFEQHQIAIYDGHFNRLLVLHPFSTDLCILEASAQLRIYHDHFIGNGVRV